MDYLVVHSHNEAKDAKLQARKEMVEEQQKGSYHRRKAVGGEEGFKKKQETISKIFGLSTDIGYSLKNVSQQLQIWQDHMKGFSEMPARLIEFNNTAEDSSSVQNFIKDLKRYKIVYSMFSNQKK